MRELVATLVLIAVALPGAALAADAASPIDAAAVYRQLREARPDGRTIEASGLVLRRDVFQFNFAQGRFHLLEPVAGRSPGAVFIGRGVVNLTPATDIERHRLALLSGVQRLESLGDGFSVALFLFDDQTEGAILGQGAIQEATADPDAVAAFEVLSRGMERGLGVDVFLRLLRNRLNDEGRLQGPFYAALEGERLPLAVVAVDAMGVLDAEGSCLWASETLEEPGRGGVFWYSNLLEEQLASGADGRGELLVDATHYAIESKVSRSTDLEGVTNVEFQVLVPGLRVLPIDLVSSLEIREAAVLVEDKELPVAFVQGAGVELDSAAVLFPRSLPRGLKVKLRISYAGDGVLVDDGVGIYQVEARSNWYPNLGTFRDRATYDLTFSVPKGNTVIAVGDHAGTAEEGGRVVSVWKAAHPITVAGFNYGDFARYDQQEEETGTSLEVYASTGEPDIITEINRDLQSASSGLRLRDQVEVASNDGLSYVNTYSGPSSIGVSPGSLAEVAMADATNAVRVFTRFFGPIESRRLAITQQSQWSFGQAWPSLVYLPYLAGIGRTLRVEIGLANYAGFIDEVGIHEIAHQWWGHHVGWASYRDQWLSEGSAEFSTALVLELTRGAEAYDRFWAQRRAAVLSAAKGEEVPPYLAGPIAVGFRAASDRSPRAAQALMYSKGGYVLHMLRMLMRDMEAGSDERFFAMMKDFAKTWGGRDATTEDFKAIVQKHMVPELNASGDGTVDWFFDQWVYGTEVPRHVADVTIEKAGKGRYRIVGTLIQENVPDDFLALVPAYVDLGKDGYGRFGRAPFKGNMSHKIDVTLELPRKPKGVVMNAHHEVLAFD